MKTLQFSEAIKLKDGIIYNLELHEERMQRTTMQFFEKTFPLKLSIPTDFRMGFFKCRIVYDTQIRTIEFIPYQLRTIRSFKLVECDDIDYNYKYADRDTLNSLLALKGEADDILIVKNGLISDASSSNVVFEDFGGKRFTPHLPLLKGIKRQYLLKKELIAEADISPNRLKEYKKIFLINAMIDLEDEVSSDICNIN